MYRGVITLLAVVLAAGCTPAESDLPQADPVVLGFSQVGAESGWRIANTRSIKQAAVDAGVDLRFSDGQQRQENQIAAIRSFIAQGVDVIAFSPIVESGWDEVLAEASAAGIPVILTDRAVDAADPSLYRSFLGSDFVAEGERAGQWLVERFRDTAVPVRIVELEGTVGSAPANDRKTGFLKAVAEAPMLTVVASRPGSFTRVGGKAAMEAMLESTRDIDVLFSHNDDMALGAIEAITDAGLRPGIDVTIVSVDAIHDGLAALAEGRINYIVECSPLLGPALMQVVLDVAAGRPVPERVVTEETTFTPEQARLVLNDRAY